MASKLRAVTDADAPAPKVVLNLKMATERSERDLLVTMRSKIASEIDGGVPPHTLAPLSRQLLDIDKQIRQLDARAAEESEDAGGDADDTFDASAI